MADPCEGAANWGNESSGSRANHSSYGKSKPKRRRRWKGGEEIERSSHACLSSLWIVEHGHGHDHVEKNVKPVQFAAKMCFVAYFPFDNCLLKITNMVGADFRKLVFPIKIKDNVVKLVTIDYQLLRNSKPALMVENCQLASQLSQRRFWKDCSVRAPERFVWEDKEGLTWL